MAQTHDSMAHLVVGHTLHVDEDPNIISTLDGSDGDAVPTSSTPSTSTYRQQHGRHYHTFAEGQYWLPNDETELGRLDIQHHVWRLTLKGKLHLAPLVEGVQDVLDIGTGTGQWAVEFADAHTTARVLGIDLSAIQPHRVPSNCSFVVANVESDDFNAEGRHFDFVHARMLMFGIHDWPRLLQRAWDALKPGGWLELLEPIVPIGFVDDGAVRPDSPFFVYTEKLREACGKNGIDTLVTNQFEAMLERQGFRNVRRVPVQWAIGPWAKGVLEKEVGKWTLINTGHFNKPMALALFTKHLGWTVEEVDAFLMKVDVDMKDPKKHYYWQLNIFTAQKPSSAA